MHGAPVGVHLDADQRFNALKEHLTRLVLWEGVLVLSQLPEPKQKAYPEGPLVPSREVLNVPFLPPKSHPQEVRGPSGLANGSSGWLVFFLRFDTPFAAWEPKQTPLICGVLTKDNPHIQPHGCEFE